jgi:two-component system, LytTR family, sensor histidine kinase AlgZ
MHPILATPRRLLLYLLAWTPILGLLAYVTWASGGASWIDATAALAPACLIYAFVCLAPWYMWGARAPAPSRIRAMLITFSAAAVVASLVFVGIARAATAALAHVPALAGIDQRLRSQLPLLFGMGVLLYLLSAGLHYAALAAEASRDAERRAAEARALAREAELQALRMQINPHFLFNSLHSISALATLDGARAREMCVRLAGFLRSSLGLADRETIPLGEELALARSYLEVEQVRFGARLRVEERIEPECEACGVPALLLQPLVENAVKHGIAGLTEGGWIRLEARRTGAGVSIVLENDYDPEAAAPGRLGIGLSHAGKRLLVRYGGEATLEAGGRDGVYRVVLRLPCESPMASSNRA